MPQFSGEDGSLFKNEIVDSVENIENNIIRVFEVLKLDARLYISTWRVHAGWVPSALGWSLDVFHAMKSEPVLEVN